MYYDEGLGGGGVAGEMEKAAEGKRNIIKAQEIATNVVLKLQKLGMVPPFAWTGMDPGKEVVNSMPIQGYTASKKYCSRTIEFWWDEWVHAYVELRKPYSVEGPWNPSHLVLRGVLSVLPDPTEGRMERFAYQYRELRALLDLASGESVFYHPANSTSPNSQLWSGRYETEL